jgi:hypothetical protein
MLSVSSARTGFPLPPAHSAGGFAMKIQRDIAGVLACVATSAMIVVATPLSARAGDLLDDHQHMPLINTGSGKCFEPRNWPGLPVQQRTCGGVIPIQFYRFQNQGWVDFNDQGWFDCRWLGCIGNSTTGYLINNLETNLCLDVRDGSKNDWAVVQQSTCDKTVRSMLWYVGPGDFPNVVDQHNLILRMFKVRNFNSDRCLDVKGGSSDENAQLQQYRCTSINLAQNFSQKFPKFWPLVDLNGRWTDGSTQNGTTRCCVVIYAGLGSIVIDMSAFNRPAARGHFDTPFSITVKFADDAEFTGKFETSTTVNRINWSNGSVWTKKP